MYIMIKLEFKFSNKFNCYYFINIFWYFFYIFFDNFFLFDIFFWYIFSSICKLNVINKIKKRQQKEALEIYQNLSKEEKEKEWQYYLSESEKQKLVEYRKKYYRIRKKGFVIIIRKKFNLKYFLLENFGSFIEKV